MSHQKRRYHTKSKNGCQACKKRHVKCDEQGPPCANCVTRETACVYGTAPCAEISQNGVRSGPLSEPSTALEMALLHRWTTTTSLSLCCIEEEYEVMQVLVPQTALKLPFLMDGMMAISALDIAINDEGSKYPTLDADYPLVAARYYDRGLTAFRKLLTGSRDNLDPESHQAMVIFSSIAGIMNMAMPQFDVGPDVGESSTGRTLAAAMIHFDMIHGAGQVVLIALDWLEAGPYPTNARPNWKEDVLFELLDEDTKAAVAHLQTVNDMVTREDGSLPTPPSSGKDADGSTNTDSEAARSTKAMYKKAISYLEEFFARTLDRNTRGFGLLWPTMAGAEYAAAARRSEPLAILLLMYWGVILHRMSKDYWWAGRPGRALVREGEVALRSSPHAMLPAWVQSVEWALAAIGETRAA
ncbi:hypothetical protein RB597_007549 [Gaeumannomyces tritici]